MKREMVVTSVNRSSELHHPSFTHPHLSPNPHHLATHPLLHLYPILPSLLPPPPPLQFIVVSLKEGMFNNANVIFRTKFVDGVSTVTRTVNTRSPEGGGSKAAAARGRAALRENVRA